MIEIPKILMRGRAPGLSPIPGVWFAGGAVRRWFTGEAQDSDVDVFGTGWDRLEEFAKVNGFAKPVQESKNASTYLHGETEYQLIKVHSAKPEETLDKFDFQHCRFAWDGSKVIAPVEAIVCATRKALMVHQIQKSFELDSLRRAFKYQKQGFTPCLGCLSAIAASFREVTEQQLKDQTEISPNGGRRGVRFD